MTISESYEVTVFCDSGSPKHGTKRPNPVVQGFLWRGFLSDQPGLGWTDHNRSARLINARAHVDAARAMVGDVPYSRDEHEGQRVQVRESWSLKCEKCGHRVPIRSEKLYPMLTRMKDMGLDRIGLREIQDGLHAAG